jgi:hypothetical protein
MSSLFVTLALTFIDEPVFEALLAATGTVLDTHISPPQQMLRSEIKCKH